MIDMSEIVEHEFCLRCGRKLKSPEARQSGYGPVCRKKMVVKSKSRLFVSGSLPQSQEFLPSPEPVSHQSASSLVQSASS